MTYDLTRKIKLSENKYFRLEDEQGRQGRWGVAPYLHFWEKRLEEQRSCLFKVLVFSFIIKDIIQLVECALWPSSTPFLQPPFSAIAGLSVRPFFLAVICTRICMWKCDSILLLWLPHPLHFHSPSSATFPPMLAVTAAS